MRSYFGTYLDIDLAIVAISIVTITIKNITKVTKASLNFELTKDTVPDESSFKPNTKLVLGSGVTRADWPDGRYDSSRW